MKRIRAIGIPCISDKVKAVRLSALAERFSLPNEQIRHRGRPNLGLLLFLLYINDLPNCLSDSVPAMFADDTNVTVAASSKDDLQLMLNVELKNLHHWLLANMLSINVRQNICLLGHNKG